MRKRRGMYGSPCCCAVRLLSTGKTVFPRYECDMGLQTSLAFPTITPTAVYSRSSHHTGMNDTTFMNDMPVRVCLRPLWWHFSCLLPVHIMAAAGERSVPFVFWDSSCLLASGGLLVMTTAAASSGYAIFCWPSWQQTTMWRRPLLFARAGSTLNATASYLCLFDMQCCIWIKKTFTLALFNKNSVFPVVSGQKHHHVLINTYVSDVPMKWEFKKRMTG